MQSADSGLAQSGLRPCKIAGRENRKFYAKLLAKGLGSGNVSIESPLLPMKHPVSVAPDQTGGARLGDQFLMLGGRTRNDLRVSRRNSRIAPWKRVPPILQQRTDVVRQRP